MSSPPGKIAVLSLTFVAAIMPAWADTASSNDHPVRQAVSAVKSEARCEYNKAKGYFHTHPRARVVGKDALVGAGLGSMAGLINRKGLVGGAFIGAAAGTLFGLTRTSPTMARHPILKDSAAGASIGLGLGGSGKTAALGGAIGLGVGALKRHRLSRPAVPAAPNSGCYPGSPASP